MFMPYTVSLHTALFLWDNPQWLEVGSRLLEEEGTEQNKKSITLNSIEEKVQKERQFP